MKTAADKLMETTVSGVISIAHEPFNWIEDFTDENRKFLVTKLKQIFPQASEEAIESVLFRRKQKG